MLFCKQFIVNKSENNYYFFNKIFKFIENVFIVNSICEIFID